jgi:hypothetical protein
MCSSSGEPRHLGPEAHFDAHVEVQVIRSGFPPISIDAPPPAEALVAKG